MNTAPAALVVPSLSEVWALLVRTSVVLLVGISLGRMLRLTSAALRHHVWVATLAGTLAVGLVGLFTPHSGWGLAARYGWDPLGGIASAALGQAIASVRYAGWVLGVCIFALRISRGIITTTRLSKRAQVITDPDWQSCLAAAARDVQLRSVVQLRWTAETPLPVTWGIRDPVVLLPLSAAAWSHGRRRIVLLHELAHVRRRDCWTELFVSLVCALYWFHPGVWWVALQLRLAREQACDNMVVGAGTLASEYAGHLVALLRTANDARRRAAFAPGAAGHSALEERLLSLLETRETQSSIAKRTLAAFAPLMVTAIMALWSPAADQPGSSGVSEQRTGAKSHRCDCIRKHQVGPRLKPR